MKDPICGIHTARSSAIAGRFEGRDVYFCSEECAQKARAASSGGHLTGLVVVARVAGTAVGSRRRVRLPRRHCVYENFGIVCLLARLGWAQTPQTDSCDSRPTPRPPATHRSAGHAPSSSKQQV